MSDIPQFTVTLPAEEWNAVLTVLGNMPTSSGVWPLAMKIKGQVESGIAQRQAAPEPGNRQQRRAADRQAGKPAPKKAAAAPPAK
jgi:hypothetical protein